MADPDLQIKGGGRRLGHSNPEIREEAGLKFFLFGLKIRGDPFPGSATDSLKPLLGTVSSLHFVGGDGHEIVDRRTNARFR